MTRAEAKAIVMSSLVRKVFLAVSDWSKDDRFRGFKPLLDPSSGWTISHIVREKCLENELCSNLLSVWLTRRMPGDLGSIQTTFFCIEL